MTLTRADLIWMSFDKASIHGSRAVPALRQSNFFKHFAKCVQLPRHR